MLFVAFLAVSVPAPLHPIELSAVGQFGSASTVVTPPTALHIDALLKSHDFNRLEKLLTPIGKGQRSPFRVIQAGGAYDVGRFGWSASELPGINGGPDFVVIGTQLTSEDIGQLVFQRVGDKLKFVPEADSLGVSVLHHSFNLKFLPLDKKVELSDRVDFRSTDSSATFLFRMSPQYVVSEIDNEKGARVAFTQSQGVVVVQRPPSSKFALKLRYGAVVDLPGYAGSIGPKEATLTNDYWYPMIARNPATYDIEIHAPKSWTPLAQGEQTSKSDVGDETVARFRMGLPVTYYSVSAAPYKIVSKNIGGRRFSVWSLRMSQPAMEAQCELYAPILKFYDQFSKFPFSGYGAVDSAVYGGGALEAYSFATYGGGLPHEDGHEPSHTWWGGIMDNTYLHSLWNESFANFCDGLYHRNVPIGNVSERRLAFVAASNGERDYDEIPMLDSGVDSGAVSGALGYGKGAKVLQMLEQYLGTPKMVRVMHDWIARHKKGTPAEWPEFIETVQQEVPKLKLESFFNDWFSRPGYARLDAKVGYSGSATSIDLKWKGPRFRMPLLVLIRTKGLDSYKLLDTGEGDHFTIAGRKPDLVSIDPYRQALRDVDSDETPVQFNNVGGSNKYVDPRHTDWISASGGTAADPSVAPELSGSTVVGSPETLPWMRPLCERAGFKVKGSKLTYKGTTIDLEHGCAMAVVSVGQNRYCKIVLGKTRVRPDVGRASVAITDDLGRFLRGQTDPKTRGKLTYRF